MSAARILLIENTRAKRASFADALSKRYQVISVPSGKQALEQTAVHVPAVMILDAISMRTPGDRICRLLREQLPHIPLIHLHPGGVDARSEADVVLTEPFTSRKLINSIERMFTINHPVVPSGEVLLCGAFAMYPAQRLLVINGQEKSLTPKQAALIEIFFRNPGETLGRDVLMERVWDTKYMGDTRTLDVHIRWIRSAIEADPSKPQYLKTVRGVGYRFDLPCDAPQSPPEEQPVAVLEFS